MWKWLDRLVSSPKPKPPYVTLVIATRYDKGVVAIYARDADGKLYPITIDAKEIPNAKSQRAAQLE